MEVYERIKYLRKHHLKLTQDQFGEKLGVSRAVIRNIELNLLARPEQKEPLLRLICKTFNISYRWLTTGEGEMNETSSNPFVDNLINTYALNSTMRSAIETFLTFDRDQRKKIIEIAQSFVQSLYFADKSADSLATDHLNALPTTGHSGNSISSENSKEIEESDEE